MEAISNFEIALSGPLLSPSLLLEYAGCLERLSAISGEMFEDRIFALYVQARALSPNNPRVHVAMANWKERKGKVRLEKQKEGVSYGKQKVLEARASWFSALEKSSNPETLIGRYLNFLKRWQLHSEASQIIEALRLEQ